jgi:hypothetical protein
MQRETIVRFIERKSDVPLTLRSDVRFRREVNVLVRLLSQWEMLELFGIHETGHELFYRKAGFATFRYTPSTVIYKPANTKQPFEGQIARIIPDDYTKPDHDDWLLDLAKGYTAGGECSRWFTTTDYGGDTIDRQLWNEMCAECYKDSTQTKGQVVAIAEDLWDKAQKAVRKELQESAALRAQVRSKAKEVIPQLFPWTKYD